MFLLPFLFSYGSYDHKNDKNREHGGKGIFDYMWYESAQDTKQLLFLKNINNIVKHMMHQVQFWANTQEGH